MSDTSREELLEALRQVDRPAAFCAHGRLPPLLPGLEVAGVGAVALPLRKSEAELLQKHARQAPYGKGTETLVDTNVRKVWEFLAENISLTNPEWSGIVAAAVDATKKELGLEKQKLEATLYDLLLYEKGSFFLPHRDGEKLDRMVATLVIALPSEHTGGELIVRHEGREATIDFGPDSRFHTQFAAFYADCEHEVRPVTRGYRLALVYNLTLARSKRGISAPTSGEHITAVRQILETWAWSAPRREARVRSKGGYGGKLDEDDGDDPGQARTTSGRTTKLAVLLDHQYSEKGLVRDALKGADRAKADVLFAAGEAAGCDAALALVTHWISGSAEYDDRAYSRSRRRRYGYRDDDDRDASDHGMGEVYDERRTAEHFSNAQGRRLSYGSIPLDETEILSPEPMSKGTPDKEDYEGYTGNAGMTLERWYHRAAIVLWPKATRLDVLCQAGVETAIGGLTVQVREWKAARKAQQPALRKECLDFAQRIIDCWPESERWWTAPRDRPPLLPLLVRLDDLPLIVQWIERVLARDSTVDPGKDLGDLCQKYGWNELHVPMRGLFQESSRSTSNGTHCFLLTSSSGLTPRRREMRSATIWRTPRSWPWSARSPASRPDPGNTARWIAPPSSNPLCRPA